MKLLKNARLNGVLTDIAIENGKIVKIGIKKVPPPIPIPAKTPLTIPPIIN